MREHTQQEKDLIMAKCEVDKTRKEMEEAMIGIRKSEAFCALAEIRLNIAKMKEILCNAIINKRNFIHDISQELKECYAKLELSIQSFNNGDYRYVEKQRHNVSCSLYWYKECEEDYNDDRDD